MQIYHILYTLLYINYGSVKFLNKNQTKKWSSMASVHSHEVEGNPPIVHRITHLKHWCQKIPNS